MKFNKLSQSAAFGTGSSLWVFPAPQDSIWAQKIDCLLNFQMYKAKKRKNRPLNEKLVQIINKNEIDLEMSDSKDSDPLLIGSHFQLPSQYALCIPKQESPEKWVQLAFQVWDNIRRPSLRFFLPKGMSQDQLICAWPSTSHGYELSYIVDPGAQK